jgi:tetratricopeptide (TPR) repeat protein
MEDSKKTSEPRQRLRRSLIILGYFLLATICVAPGVKQYFEDRNNYNKGLQAYQEANCTVAVEYFDRIINTSRVIEIGRYTTLARQEREKCLPQVAIDRQKAGDFSGALIAYIDLVSDYSGSVPVESIRNGVESLFKQAEPSTLTNLESCNKVDILIENDLIPERDTNLPLLYFACGQVYRANQDYITARRMYESFLNDYPNHSLVSDVKVELALLEALLAVAETATADAKADAKAALARSTVAEAKEAGAGNLDMPIRIGSTDGDEAVVFIQNDSTYQLRIVFGGPEGYFEELAACSSCETYPRGGSPSDLGKRCRQQATVGRYLLKPGRYDVLIETKGNEVVSSVGSWSLSGGTEYGLCFFFEVKSVP